jgi:hypothetical protein
MGSSAQSSCSLFPFGGILNKKFDDVLAKAKQERVQSRIQAHTRGKTRVARLSNDNPQVSMGKYFET